MNKINRPGNSQKQPNSMRNCIRKDLPKLYLRFHPLIIIRPNDPVCDGN